MSQREPNLANKVDSLTIHTSNSIILPWLRLKKIGRVFPSYCSFMIVTTDFISAELPPDCCFAIFMKHETRLL